MVKKKEKILILSFCIITSSVLWCLCWNYSPFVFQVNDDMYMKRLVSSAETGMPENRLFFVGIVLGTIMSSLYQLNVNFPWYSFIMVGTLFVSTIILLFIVLDNLTSKLERCIAAFIYLGFFYIFLVPQIINIQFTVISSYICGVGILMFWLEKGEKLYYILSLCLMLIAFQIRKECVLMALPFILVIWIMKFISPKRGKAIWLWAIAGVILLAVSLFLEGIAYRGREWKEFADFSVARSELYDYGTVPEFDENKNIYQELGISLKERNIVDDYNLMFANSIDAEDLEKLSELHERDSIDEVFSIVIEKNMPGNSALTSFIWLFYFIELVLIIAAIDSRRYKILMIIELLSIKAVSFCLWIYLVGKGRYPDRIMVSLYFLECICLVGHFLIHIGCFTRKKIKVIAACLLICGTLSVCYRQERPYINSLKNSISVRLEYSTAFNSLQEYIKQHNENFYYIDIDVMKGGVTESVFCKDEKIFNQIFMGGWMVKSPWYEKKLELYELEGTEEDLKNENVFLVFKNRNSIAKNNLEIFLQDKCSKVFFITKDIIETEQGVEYEIVKVDYHER